MENINNGLIYGKISQIMKDCPAIGKNQRNAQQGYAYRGIDDAMNTLQNLLPKYGVFYVPEVLESSREERTTKSGGNLIYSILKVKYTFYAEDGSHVAAVVQSEGMDKADKSSNKAMSAACKYALFQVFNIPTKEFVDPDATTPDESVKNSVEQVQSAPQKPVQPVSAVPQMHTIPNYPGDEAFLRDFRLPDGFQTVLTLADAELMEDSAGNMYGSKPLSQLWQMLDIIKARLEKNHLKPEEREGLQDKVDAILLLMDEYKHHPERIKQAGN